VATEDEKDYSQYVGHIGKVSQVISIFAGFTLTTLILVINLFSDRSAPLVQATFFLLTFLFYLFTFLLAWVGNLDLFFIKNIPPLTLGMKISGFLEFLGIGLLGLMMPMLFFFFNLFLLSALSIITWAFFMIGSYFFTVRPINKINPRAKASL
jgi:hypothetical protein